jgi:NAD(P)-dependent dehydrogenase (short-subunit alcohol dehydrogenase family)
MNDTNRKVAVVTGASRGLGAALSRQLVRDGWAVMIDARGAKSLDTVRGDLAALGKVVAIPGDVADPGHRQALAEAARELGGVDLVVNNASILGPSPQPVLLDYPLDVFEQVYKVNLFAPLGILQTLKPFLKDKAMVINITSDAGVEAYPGWGGYGSSKAALEHLSAVLATEMPDWRIYWVDPGDMQTQMQQEAFPNEDISDRLPPEAVVPGFLKLINGDYASGRYKAKELSGLE